MNVEKLEAKGEKADNLTKIIKCVDRFKNKLQTSMNSQLRNRKRASCIEGLETSTPVAELSAEEKLKCP